MKTNTHFPNNLPASCSYANTFLANVRAFVWVRNDYAHNTSLNMQQKRKKFGGGTNSNAHD